MKDGAHVVDFWDISSTTDPKKLADESGVEQMETLFFSFDRGTQDPTLFNMSYQFPDIECKPRPRTLCCFLLSLTSLLIV